MSPRLINVGKECSLRLNGQPIVLQVPMLTWGMTEWVDEVNGSVKYDMALQFDPHKVLLR